MQCDPSNEYTCNVAIWTHGGAAASILLLYTFDVANRQINKERVTAILLNTDYRLLKTCSDMN